uniref:C-type lectin domain-containing protein n=1 Tax=Malurus cyaneus samueli TaxID=2593467 RepID=A0A8C5X2W1_9PASS
MGYGGCGRGAFQGHCYRYFARRRSWEDAERDCRPAGRRPFTSIHSQEEHSFINGGLGDAPRASFPAGFGHENTWIGLNDRILAKNTASTSGWTGWRRALLLSRRAATAQGSPRGMPVTAPAPCPTPSPLFLYPLSDFSSLG